MALRHEWQQEGELCLAFPGLVKVEELLKSVWLFFLFYLKLVFTLISTEMYLKGEKVGHWKQATLIMFENIHLANLEK